MTAMRLSICLSFTIRSLVRRGLRALYATEAPLLYSSYVDGVRGGDGVHVGRGLLHDRRA